MKLYKKDDNHDFIKKEFQKLGFTWIDTHWSRGLLLDGIAILRGKCRFIEIKNKGKHSLTDDEIKFISAHNGLCEVVWSSEQVVSIYNRMLNG